MGWSKTTKIMTSPISIWDIAAAVKKSSGFLDYLIREGNINMWAKYKPVRSSAKVYLGPIGRRAASFGLSIPSASTVASLISLYDSSLLRAGLNGWEYLRPRGLATYNEIYRAYDFIKTYDDGHKVDGENGYTSKAPNPFGEYQGAGVVSQHGGTIWCENDWQRLQASWPDQYLALSDFNTLPNLYYGFIMYAPNQPFYIATADEKITQNGAGTRDRGNEYLHVEAILETDTTFPTQQEYRLYPILSSAGGFHNLNNGPHAFNYSDRNRTDLGIGTMYPIPLAYPNFISIVEHAILIRITAPKATLQLDGRYTITFNYYIKNNTERTYYIRGDMVKLRFRGKSYTESMLVGEYEESIANVVNISLAAGQTSQTFSYTKTNVSGQSIQKVWVGVDYDQTGMFYDNHVQASADGIMYPATP